jgi:hypothetical protein
MHVAVSQLVLILILVETTSLTRDKRGHVTRKSGRDTGVRRASLRNDIKFRGPCTFRIPIAPACPHIGSDLTDVRLRSEEYVRLILEDQRMYQNVS